MNFTFSGAAVFAFAFLVSHSSVMWMLGTSRLFHPHAIAFQHEPFNITSAYVTTLNPHSWTVTHALACMTLTLGHE